MESYNSIPNPSTGLVNVQTNRLSKVPTKIGPHNTQSCISGANDKECKKNKGGKGGKEGKGYKGGKRGKGDKGGKIGKGEKGGKGVKYNNECICSKEDHKTTRPILIEFDIRVKSIVETLTNKQTLTERKDWSDSKGSHCFFCNGSHRFNKCDMNPELLLCKDCTNEECKKIHSSSDLPYHPSFKILKDFVKNPIEFMFFIKIVYSAINIIIPNLIFLDTTLKFNTNSFSDTLDIWTRMYMTAKSTRNHESINLLRIHGLSEIEHSLVELMWINQNPCPWGFNCSYKRNCRQGFHGVNMCTLESIRFVTHKLYEQEKTQPIRLPVKLFTTVLSRSTTYADIVAIIPEQRVMINAINSNNKELNCCIKNVYEFIPLGDLSSVVPRQWCVNSNIFDLVPLLDTALKSAKELLKYHINTLNKLSMLRNMRNGIESNRMVAEVQYTKMIDVLSCESEPLSDLAISYKKYISRKNLDKATSTQISKDFNECIKSTKVGSLYIISKQFLTFVNNKYDETLKTSVESRNDLCSEISTVLELISKIEASSNKVNVNLRQITSYDKVVVLSTFKEIKSKVTVSDEEWIIPSKFGKFKMNTKKKSVCFPWKYVNKCNDISDVPTEDQVHDLVVNVQQETYESIQVKDTQNKKYISSLNSAKEKLKYLSSIVNVSFILLTSCTTDITKTTCNDIQSNFIKQIYESRTQLVKYKKCIDSYDNELLTISKRNLRILKRSTEEIDMIKNSIIDTISKVDNIKRNIDSLASDVQSFVNHMEFVNFDVFSESEQHLQEQCQQSTIEDVDKYDLTISCKPHEHNRGVIIEINTLIPERVIEIKKNINSIRCNFNKKKYTLTIHVVNGFNKETTCNEISRNIADAITASNFNTSKIHFCIADNTNDPFNFNSTKKNSILLHLSR